LVPLAFSSFQYQDLFEENSILILENSPKIVERPVSAPRSQPEANVAKGDGDGLAQWQESRHTGAITAVLWSAIESYVGIS